ncbi:MAG: membrane protein of unknown function [Promethearchaeota archaeon]|nr:MAG: membrane protein of unknown function [Candidatus Lokiarchaeota archaeon]
MTEVKQKSDSYEEKGWKTVLIIFLIVATSYLIPIAIDYISTFIGTAYNPTNPNIYKYSNEIIYNYRNGTKGEYSTLKISSKPDQSKEYTSVIVELNDNLLITYECEYNSGYMKNTETYSIFWVFTLNNLLDPLGILLESDEIKVMDPVGILGKVNETYSMVFEEKTVIYDVAPMLFGAQYSFEVELFNSNDRKLGSAIIDSTSGILEIVDGTIDLELINPGIYPMSRHRLTIFGILLFTVVLFPVGVYLYYKYHKKFEKEDYLALTSLVAMGTSSVMIDFILDVWMYAFFGIIFMYSLHIIFAIVYALLSHQFLKVNPIWITPLLIEMIFPIALTLHAGVPFYPALLVGVGSFSSFLFILFRVGQKKPIL